MSTFATPTRSEVTQREPSEPDRWYPAVEYRDEGEEPGDYWAACSHCFACLMQYERYADNVPNKPKWYPDRNWQNMVGQLLGCADGMCDYYKED